MCLLCMWYQVVKCICYNIMLGELLLGHKAGSVCLNVHMITIIFVQVNLEYLSHVVIDSDGFLFPDSVVGTDSHTTMINGLGILGWGK